MSKTFADLVIEGLMNNKESRFYKEVRADIEREVRAKVFGRMIRTLVDDGYTLQQVAELMDLDIEETRALSEHQQD